MSDFSTPFLVWSPEEACRQKERDAKQVFSAACEWTLKTSFSPAAAATTHERRERGRRRRHPYQARVSSCRQALWDLLCSQSVSCASDLVIIKLVKFFFKSALGDCVSTKSRGKKFCQLFFTTLTCVKIPPLSCSTSVYTGCSKIIGHLLASQATTYPKWEACGCHP